MHVITYTSLIILSQVKNIFNTQGEMKPIKGGEF